MAEGQAARVFLAVGISAEMAAAIADLQQAIRRGVPAGLLRFVDAGQAHVTLRFLGQRSSEEQARIARAAAAAARGAIRFALAFGELGVFPDERRPHTLWLGLTKGKSEIVTLAARLDAELAPAGFTPEGRPYVPHLTLARVKQRPPPGFIRELLGRELGADGAAGHFFPSDAVSSFALMESRASGGGVRYVPLQIFPLETACTPSK